MMMSCSRCFMILKVHSLRFLYDGVYCQEYTHMLLDFALHCILHVTTRRDPQHFHHKILWSSTGTDVRSVIRMRSAAVSISAIVMMGYMWTISICPNTPNQKKIRSLSDLQLSGSWGPWGPWQDCSRSCGGGLQKQIRVCLSVHSQQSRNRDLSVPQHRPTTAHKPTTARDHTHGWRKSNSSRIGPRAYSYSRNPYAMPFRKDSGRTSDLRQRRSDRTHFKERSYFRQTSDQSHIHHINITNTSCSGESHQHKICNNMTCPSSSTLIRQQQCSVFNTRVFMGRLYDWEPFNFSEHDCQLNCRAVGFRFYIRQSDDVIDGSSCGHMAVCLAGKCQRVGCDGVVASEQIGDRCGVCGGDGRSCKLISGLFQHSLSKVGYHKIVEIPSGASKINITERMKSTNYLALRSRSGRSIINGNWAIDSPGLYEGAGTIFTYRRPNEISSTAGESFLAEGPTNDILEVYMIYQQPNPGVHYEFLLPSENTQNSPVNLNVINGQTPSNPNVRQNPSEDRERSGVVQNNNLPASRTHAYREYNWKLMRRSDCSASCGRGVRYGVFSCVHRNTNVQVQNNLCDSSTKPDQQESCNIRPCPAFWDIGEWSECSKSCGLGSQHRQVLCRQVFSNRTSTVHVSRCHHLERPETSSTCQLKICSEWNILSDWSPCSVPCGVGQRSRQVQCVSNVGDVAADEECNMKLRPSDVENCDAGPCTRSWFFSDWSSQCSAECGPGVRTRSVVCFNNHISSVPLESCGSERPPEVKPCNSGSCDSRTEWFTGPWSQCSAACGSGYQERAVVCLMTSHDGFIVMPSYECSSLEKPLSQQNCIIKTCTHTWYHTDWSQCSKSCDGGYRVREVRCISDHMTISDSCEEISKPHMREMCNSEPCLPLIDEKCRDMYLKCNVVVQARLCVYEYYKTVCCASCTRVAQKRHR